MDEGNEPEQDAPPDGRGRPYRVARGLAAAWHRAASAVPIRAARILRAAATKWASQWTRVLKYLRTAGEPWCVEGARERETAAGAGLRAFAFGLILAGWAAGSARNALLPGVALVAAEVLWASARFIIIAWLMPTGAIDRGRLSTAYFAGLIPFVFGITMPLRVISLLASGYLTRRGLLGAGVPTHDANQAVAWSFGGQLGVAIVGWGGRALVALLAGI